MGARPAGKASRNDVLGTSYARDGKTLTALASRAPDQIKALLHIDWKALGLKLRGANLQSPALVGFQPAATCRPGDAIPIASGTGWLLILD